MKQHYQTRRWVPFPVELVFAFFANPSNLPHLLLPRWQARVEDARIVPPPARPVAAQPARRYRSVAAGAGSEILLSAVPIPLLPKRVSWLARITEFEWNDHFVDEQVRGPFARFSHLHRIQAEAREGVEGTLVQDEIDFALPYGFLGQLFAPQVERRFEQLLAYREKRLPEILAVASRQAVKRG